MLFDEADESSFGSILANSNHVLQSYLSERSLSQYKLRQRTHTIEQLNKATELNPGAAGGGGCEVVRWHRAANQGVGTFALALFF